MTGLTPVASSDAFLGAIQKSGLLSADAFAKVQNAAAATTDPKLLARDLLKAGTLTKWQVGQLLHGYHQLVIGKYKLLDQLETGEIGRVYLAEHAQMGRRHLLKVLSKRHSADPATVKRFLNQAQQACGLDHRHVSHVYDVNQDGDRNYVVMEHVEGYDLEQLVEKSGPLPPADALEFLRQAADGLLHAHAAGVVHGDLKPSNLLLDNSGTIKIADIGLAGLTGSATGAPTTGSPGAGVPAADSPDETGENAIPTSTVFRAPEVAAGNPAERVSDIYSLGSVLCYLLTGKPAENGAAAAEQLRAISEIPAALADACARLMAEQPQDRPASVEEAWNLLVAAAAVAPEAAPANGAARAAGDSARGKRPRMAQRLDEDVEHVSEIVADDPADLGLAETADSESPFAGLVITPREREVKQPADAAARSRGSQEAKPAPRKAQALAIAEKLPANDWTDELPASDLTEKPLAKDLPAADVLQQTVFKPAAEQTTFTPLIIAGVLGGGGALLIGGIALVWMLSSGPRENKVAQTPAAKTPPAVSKSIPSPVGAESNPELGVEKNPEVNPIPPAPPIEASAPPAPPTPPAASSTGKKKRRAAAPAPATSDNATEKPADSPPAAKVEVPGEPDAAKTDAKPADKNDAKPEEKKDEKPAAKPEAKPAAKAAPKAPPSPFRGFTAAVALPELPEAAGQPAGDALAPQTLGPCKLADKAPLEVTLKGGSTASRLKQSFELAPQSGKPRVWEFLLAGGDAPVTIATLSAQDDSVVFQWTEKAVEQPQPARYLCNCLLELTSGTDRHTAALRLPIETDPMIVEVERRGAPLKLQIPDLPPAKRVFIEVARCEGFKQLRVDPAKPVNPGELITVWTGPDEKTPLLALRIDTLTSTRVLTVEVTPHVKVEGAKSTRLFSKKDLTKESNQVTQEFTQLQNKSKALKEKKPTPPKGMSATEFNKKLDEYMKTTLPKEIADRQAQLEQLRFLNEFASKDTEPKIHFRVFHETGEGPLDLLRTYAEAPAKGKKK
jgi:serine/threonine protein kinase